MTKPAWKGGLRHGPPAIVEAMMEVGCCVQYWTLNLNQNKHGCTHKCSTKKLKAGCCCCLKSNKTGIVVAWTPWVCSAPFWTAVDINKCFFSSFFFFSVAKPTQCISPPTVLDCIHMQFCLGAEQSYQCESWPVRREERYDEKIILSNVKTSRSSFTSN